VKPTFLNFPFLLKAKVIGKEKIVRKDYASLLLDKYSSSQGRGDSSIDKPGFGAFMAWHLPWIL